MSGSGEDTEFDPARRELCPDGTCIGLIGPDGLCRECGTPASWASQDPRAQGLRPAAEVAEQLETNITVGDLAEAPPDFESRQLCPDGACIGVIGPHGRCKECGMAAAGQPLGRSG